MLLIITSCISPPIQNNLKLFSSELRIEYTKYGLESTLAHKVFDKIIICDSSNYRFNEEYIKSIEEEYDTTIECLSFDGDSIKVQKLGKGYGEGEIMSYIFRHSKLLVDEQYFFKLTGRLYVENIVNIVESVSCNCNYFNILTLRFFKAVDTRFYAIKKDDYVKGLINAYKYVDDRKNKWYELCFRDFLKINKISFSSFPVLPVIRGVSGTHGVDAFNKDINYYYQVLLTKLGMHNTLYAAITSYFLLKITQYLNGKNGL